MPRMKTPAPTKTRTKLSLSFHSVQNAESKEEKNHHSVHGTIPYLYQFSVLVYSVIKNMTYIGAVSFQDKALNTAFHSRSSTIQPITAFHFPLSLLYTARHTAIANSLDLACKRPSICHLAPGSTLQSQVKYNLLISFETPSWLWNAYIYMYVYIYFICNIYMIYIIYPFLNFLKCDIYFPKNNLISFLVIPSLVFSVFKNISRVIDYILIIFLNHCHWQFNLHTIIFVQTQK